MTFMTTPDIVSLGVFLSTWLVFNILVEFTPLRRRSLSHLMDMQRRNWMATMSQRPVKIMDVGIAGGLQQGTAFFASTSLLAIGGCFALLTSTDSVLRILADIGVDDTADRALWETKVIGLTLIYAYAFFKFGWSYRLFNYATILMGAMPDGDPPPPHARGFAERAAGVMVLAGRHFNRGQRAFFFSIGYLGWFAGPSVFVATTLFVTIVLARRQFASRARGLAESLHQLPSVPIDAKGALNTDTGSEKPLTR